MNKDFNLTIYDLEVGKKYVMSRRPNSVCYINNSGYIQDDSLSSDNKMLSISISDRFKRFDKRDYLRFKVGDVVMFYGNMVKIGWIDHCYVAIDFFKQRSNPRIAIKCPKDKFKPQCYDWINELTCFTLIDNENKEAEQ